MLYRLFKRMVAVVLGAIVLAYSPVIICVVTGLLYRIVPIRGVALLASGIIIFILGSVTIYWSIGDLLEGIDKGIN